MRMPDPNRLSEKVAASDLRPGMQATTPNSPPRFGTNWQPRPLEPGQLQAINSGQRVTPRPGPSKIAVEKVAGNTGLTSSS